MKVLSVVGARPQFVKAFPVSTALRHDHEERLVHTGQHYDPALSQVFFDELGIPEPDYNLEVGSANHGVQTGKMMAAFEPILEAEDPSCVLVYGDTNSTVAAALVAAKSDAAVAHVEAGLRSDNRAMPEEINRIVTDHVGDVLFAPTEQAVKNLERENLTARTCLTGDVMYDALLMARSRAEKQTTIREDLDLNDREYILVTIHRAANTDDADRLRAIVDALLTGGKPIVFPAHPRTVDALDRANQLDRLSNGVTMLDPQSYLEFISLLDGAERVITDSGGVQKEAFFLDTPCVTVRSETEWPETVDAGWNVLVDADAREISRHIDSPVSLDRSTKPQPYGDGHAAERIVSELTRRVADRTAVELSMSNASTN